jgi:hypothetical protein
MKTNMDLHSNIGQITSNLNDQISQNTLGAKQQNIFNHQHHMGNMLYIHNMEDSHSIVAPGDDSQISDGGSIV